MIEELEDSSDEATKKASKDTLPSQPQVANYSKSRKRRRRAEDYGEPAPFES